MPAHETEGQGITHDTETRGLATQRVKIHPRCVQNQQHLLTTLDSLCSGRYTIEMRNNMYIIQTTESLDQEEVLVALGPKSRWEHNAA